MNKQFNIKKILESRSPRFKLSFECGTNKHLELPIHNLMYLKSDASISYLFFDIGDTIKSVRISQCLKDLEDLLIEYGFFRSHRQYLVNISYVELKKHKSDLIQLFLKKDLSVPIARRRKAEIIEIFKKIA